MIHRFIYMGQQVNIGHLSNCIAEIKTWMPNNCLSLNGSKTEGMLLGSPHQLRKVGSPTLSKSLRPNKKKSYLSLLSRIQLKYNFINSEI